MSLLGIAICVEKTAPLKPGYVDGFACKVCKKELQVSPLGLAAISTGTMVPLCMPCGADMSERLRSVGVAQDFVLTQEAFEQWAQIINQPHFGRK